MKKFLSKTVKKTDPIKKLATRTYSRSLTFAQRHPLGTFFVFLAVLMTLIVGGNFVRTPTPSEIVEEINQNRQSGMDLIPAIADAGKSRLEPILLTSLTSIFGLVPITIANPLWRGLGGAIISGLMFSGVIMLFFIPVMYFFIYRESGSRSAQNKIHA